MKLIAVLVIAWSCVGSALAQAGDADGDTIADAYEIGDTDQDGIEDRLDPDDDDDGLLTRFEQPDPNQDGNPADALDTDGGEGPNYLDPDDDGDGSPTFRERALNPASDLNVDGRPDYLDADADGALYPPPDVGADADGDSLTNGQEDRDGDRVYADDDDDADLIPDYLDADDDGDGLLTRFEVGSPLSPIDSDGDGRPNYRDADDDGDGIPTSAENADPNQDGSPDDAISTAGGSRDYLNDDDDDDGVATIVERPNGLNRDSDADSIPDHLDEDDDGDGLFHEGEADTDADGVTNHLDIDDDDDRLPSREEPGTDTDGDGTADPYDADDDGDSLATLDELDAQLHAKDSDKDGIFDHLDADDDGDGVPTLDERNFSTLDFDEDGKPDYLDTDDDGDTIPTRSELGPVADVDGDGEPNWRDLDADGDGISDRDEGTGDSDGDGIPDFVERPGGMRADASVDASTSDPDAGVPDAGVRTDANTGGSGTGGGDSDSGCSVGAPRDAPAALLGLSLVLSVLVLRRRRRAVRMSALALLIAGCDEAADDEGSLDSGRPAIDAGRPDATTDAAVADAGGSLSSECTLVDLGLTDAIVESGARGWSALLHDDVVHLAYATAACVGTGVPTGTHLVHRTFRGTGSFADPTLLVRNPEGTCSLRRAPALAWSGSSVDLYFTSNHAGAYELYRASVGSEASPQQITNDMVAGEDIELATVAAPLGDSPLIAYVNQTAPGTAAQLVTSRPGLAENEVLASTAGQEPSRLALGTWTGSSSVAGALGWVSERSGAMTMRIQPLTPAGLARGASVELSGAVGALSSVAIAAAGTHVAVVYTVQSEPGGAAELRFRKLDLEGQPTGPEVFLTSSNRSTGSPSITAYATGYVIAYREIPERADVSAAIRLMFIADDGRVAGDRRLVDAQRSGGSASQVIALKDGTLVVIWSDYGPDGAQLRTLRARCL